MINFQRILTEAKRLAKECPGHVFIGGIAVYLHALSKAKKGAKPETSHDIDLMISLVDFSSLRDSDEVTSNRRLAKHQLIRDDIEFDIYVERLHKLVVPYDHAIAEAITVNGIKIAALEHLLVLKLNAYLERQGSAKGHKDQRDVVNIVLAMDGKFDRSKLAPYLRLKHGHALSQIGESLVFLGMTQGNAHQARKLRETFESFYEAMRASLKA